MKTASIFKAAIASAALFCATALTAAPVAVEDPNEFKVDFGADFRFRWEAYNDVGGRGWEDPWEDYLRIRTRVWTKIGTENVSFYGRLGNEFRHYFQGDKKGDRRFGDVIFVDNLYLDLNDVIDGVKLRIGRQDLVGEFASNRIIDDGTSVDGSRSNFFDAVRATIELGEKRTLDLVGLYCTNDDWMPEIGHRRSSKRSGSERVDYDYSGMNHHEWGLVAYYADRSNKDFGWDVYTIGKMEESSKSSRIANHNNLHNKNRHQYSTLTSGVRLLPKFTEEISGEFELAAQIGDDNLFAGMGFASLAYAPKNVLWEPVFSANVYFASGSSDGADGNNAWHSVFNRGSIFGDNPAAMMQYVGNMTNMIYPYLQASFTPADGLYVELSCGPMFTAVKEGQGEDKSGSYYGLNARSLLVANMGELSGVEKLKKTELALVAEWLHKGTYVEQEFEGNALYLCAELMQKF